MIIGTGETLLLFASGIQTRMDLFRPGFTLRDDYDGAVQRFKARNPNAPAEVKKGLFEKWSCNPDCVDEAWGFQRSP